MSAKQRRITSKDVALKAGVSQATVSYVLNKDPRQTISEETRAKVIEAMRQLDYQPYEPARLLRMGKSKVVLVVYQQSAIESGVSRILEELTEAVGKLGYSLIWQLAFSPEHEHLTANLAPAAVIWLGDSNNMNALAILQRFKAPIIMLAGRNWFEQGPRLQVEYIIKKGPRPIVFAGTEKPQLQSMSQARLDIVRQSCVENGLPEPRKVTISLIRVKARQTIANLLAVQSLPFAICAFNDDVAFAALAALSDLNIAVPESVSVIGHDDSMIAELCNPPLTTIGATSSTITERLIGNVVSVLQGGTVQEAIPLHAEVIARKSA